MSGFEVVAADMRSAADQIEAAGTGVSGADPSGRVGDISGAMRGSQSAAAAGTLATKWQQRFSTWATDAEGQATRLRQSADEYDASDYEADQRLRILMHRTGETAY